MSRTDLRQAGTGRWGAGYRRRVCCYACTTGSLVLTRDIWDGCFVLTQDLSGRMFCTDAGSF
eukprot:233735-Rhodomonas_salina.1